MKAKLRINIKSGLKYKKLTFSKNLWSKSIKNKYNKKSNVLYDVLIAD